MTAEQLKANDEYFNKVFQNANYYLFKNVLEIYKIDRIEKEIQCTEKGKAALLHHTSPEFLNYKNMKGFKITIV